MYRLRTRDCPKSNQKRRWGLPDRVFFACGACHILAYAFLDRYGTANSTALWIKPTAGHTGNHIVVAHGEWVFDYHGYCERKRYLDHVSRLARRWWPGWNATLVSLPTHVLVSEAASKTYDGLWLRQPDQYYCDALPRARTFLDRFAPPPWLG